MIGLIPSIEVAAVWTELGARVLSQTGTPIVSSELLDDGRLQPDDYTLMFSAVVPGVSATVTLQAAMDETNPYHGRSNSVALDSVTEEVELLPGVVFVFSASGSFTSSWVAVVRVGLPLGRVSTGDGAGDSVKIRVQNTGTARGEDCQASLVSVIRAYPKTGKVFESVQPFAPGAISLITSNNVAPYKLVVSNVAGTGLSRTMDITLDGDDLTVIDLVAETTGPSTGLNVTSAYRVTTGDLDGLEFQLSQVAEDGDDVNVFVFDTSLIQLSPDDGGTPTEWGTDAVDLTEDGQDAGKIEAGGYAYFYFRVVAGEFIMTGSNPFPCSVLLTGSATFSAGWQE